MTLEIVDKTKNLSKKQRLHDVLTYITDGLPKDEAVILAGIDPEKFEQHCQNDPEYDQLVTRTIIQYKHGLIKSVSSAAEDDKKVAQWLLESRYDDFNKKIKKPQDPTNQIAVVIQNIQNNSPVSSSIPATTQTHIKEAITTSQDDGPANF